jgi:hypothetical protein
MNESAQTDGDLQGALVEAVLALASAVNRPLMPTNRGPTRSATLPCPALGGGSEIVAETEDGKAAWNLTAAATAAPSTVDHLTILQPKIAETRKIATDHSGKFGSQVVVVAQRGRGDGPRTPISVESPKSDAA